MKKQSYCIKKLHENSVKFAFRILVCFMVIAIFPLSVQCKGMGAMVLYQESLFCCPNFVS